MWFVGFFWFITPKNETFLVHSSKAKTGEIAEHPGKHESLTMYVNGFIHQKILSSGE